MCEFFIEPPPDTQQTERQGERDIWIAVCDISYLPSPPPTLRAISPACGCVYQD